MSDKATGESGASSTNLEVRDPDPETARRRGLKSFDWRAGVTEHSRLNKEQFGLLSPSWRGPVSQKAGPIVERIRQPVLLPRPNPQPPNVRLALGGHLGPEPHPFDPKKILPRPPPRTLPKGATRRRNKIARTLPAFNPPVAVKEKSQISTQSLERLSSASESQSETPQSSECDALGSTVTSERKVFWVGGRWGKGVWH